MRCARPSQAGGYSATLLDGVTGSGKTAVYLEAVAETIRRGRQALILMPEIALTSQVLDRFAERFGVRPAEWHSQLSQRLRQRTWAAVAAGEATVTVGARSALFLPYADLGLIVVDEEHDPAYKQEDGVRYHARDMAVVRASVAGIPIVLASATPSVETEVNARRGRYKRAATAGALRRPASARHRGDRLKREGPPRGRFIAPRLAEAVKTAIERGEQALLFLNRRGFAPLTLCRGCGYRLACPNCDAWLVDHRFRRRLVCHHCGFAMPLPDKCPKCEAADSFAPVGPGVERLEQEAAELFPGRAHPGALQRSRGIDGAPARGARRRRGGPLRHRHRHAARRQGAPFSEAQSRRHRRCRSRALANGDPRAAERTFQLLHQVVGRAGREEGHGIGFLQTHQPEHPVMKALIAADREAFYATEIELREKTHYPPFGRLASLARLGLRQARDRRPCAARSRRRRRTTRRCACSAPPKRRSRWCAAAIASASW